MTISWRSCMLALGLTLLMAGTAAAQSARYALVIGVNRGSPEDGLHDLEHAESDARTIATALVRHGRFDPEQVIVLTGSQATRANVLGAAARIGEAIEGDGRTHESLFALFYSGHGLRGRLLAADTDLTTEDIDDILTRSRAPLRIGYFDACFSGGLRAKGVDVSPFNPIEQLPTSTLGAEGTIIISSSQGHEYSFEAQGRGGVFTQFFVESFTRAAPGQLFVDIATMWHWASDQTRAFTRRHGRVQNPALHIQANMERPVYFSFPQSRTARLVFGRDLVGCYLVRYPNSALEERITLVGRDHQVVPVYAGAVEVERCWPDATHRPHPTRLVLAPSQSVRVGDTVGRVSSTDRSENEHGALELRGSHGTTAEADSGWSIRAEAGYRFSQMLTLDGDFRSTERRHRGTLGVWVDRERWGLGVLGGMGRPSQGPVRICESRDMLDARLAGWVGRAVGPVLVRAESSGGGSYHLATSPSCPARGGWTPLVGVAVAVALPLEALVEGLSLQGRWGVDFAQSSQVADDLAWQGDPGFEISASMGF